MPAPGAGPTAPGAAVLAVSLVPGCGRFAGLEDGSECGALSLSEGWGLGDELLNVRGQGVGGRRGWWGGAVLTCGGGEGRVVMAGVLAHHLQVVEGSCGQWRLTSQHRERLLFSSRLVESTVRCAVRSCYGAAALPAG
jgi:hypothetical protein